MLYPRPSFLDSSVDQLVAKLLEDQNSFRLKKDYRLTRLEDSMSLEVDLPGFKTDSLNITLEDGRLNIKGERSLKGQGNNDKERYEQSFKVPETVNIEAISATLEDGILTVTLPYREKEKPRRIEIK